MSTFTEELDLDNPPSAGNREEFSLLLQHLAVFLMHTETFSVRDQQNEQSVDWRWCRGRRSLHWIPFNQSNNTGIKLQGLFSRSPW